MLPFKYRKKSFLKFRPTLDGDLLKKEFHSITDDEWASSYWGEIHCSVGMLLLRGGNLGTEADFYSDKVKDKEILQKLPYIEHLISENGPFGKAIYAFIFKLRPNGVTLKHQDLIEKWQDMYRIHIPIITNNGAFLIANEKSIHFAKGHAWSFDNQSDHGVVNGPEERVHLIIDVPFTEKMAQAYDEAQWVEGNRNPAHIKRISEDNMIAPSYPGDIYINDSIKRLTNDGLNLPEIAEAFNKKKIPSKSYPAKPWDEEMLKGILEKN